MCVCLYVCIIYNSSLPLVAAITRQRPAHRERKGGGGGGGGGRKTERQSVEGSEEETGWGMVDAT